MTSTDTRPPPEVSDRSERGRLRVLHVDHTTSIGGAELALCRMLQVEQPWCASLALPRAGDLSLGAFEALARRPDVAVHVFGPPQPAGASGAANGRRAQADFVRRIVQHAVALRTSRAYREADLVHANTSRSAVYSTLAAALSPTPLVLHLRDLVAVDSLGQLGFTALSRLLARADAVIANSETTLGSAQPFLRSSTTAAVVASPIGDVVRAPADHALRPVLRIGMVARIDDWKGQDVLARAFADGFSGTDVRLTFAGSATFGKEPVLDSLMALIDSLGIHDQVDILGHVDDVSALLQTFDICVQASTRPEPLGQNVLQYLAAGKPTVAVGTGGPAEWITSGTNGLLVPMGDVGALAGALRSLALRPRLRFDLATAAASMNGLPTTETAGRAHADVYETVMSQSRRRPRRSS